ncbi:DUF4012 domain-containing protein [Leifsonia sp. NPDC058292]|uniref:DUF4012 domain-containing protein n=1 Tax=Leifsonia sp. NPDC058292 TaxID=3346428 RepID=UPI0036DE833F
MIFALAWVGIRGLLAKSALEGALPYAKTVQSSITSGDLDAAGAAARQLGDRAHTAADLTGDPIWRAMEFVPGAGANLTAVRTAASASETLASQVIKPLVAVAELVDPARMKPADGAIDIAPITEAKPTVVRAQQAFHHASASVAAIDDSAVIGPVRTAVGRLKTMLVSATPGVDALGNSARLLPTMLGSDGPRTYLLLVQNPAELRSTGGLVGALALITADHGRLALTAQASGTSIQPSPTPVAAIPASTQGLYGPLLARFIQDVNLTPDFPLAASTASAMWKAKFGGTIDGVLTIDPVALSYLLGATGPVSVSTGETLTGQNTVKTLLSDVYFRWAEPEQQDAFFASAAEAVFTKVASGAADGSALVKALAHAGDERRLLIWSAHTDEQKVLASTSLSGVLPESTSETAALGVYFNDATGSKMDYYLKTQVEAGTAICRSDGKPSSRVTVTLTNTAPSDAATSLPAYVTGAGSYGVPPGSIRTRVAVYGAEGGLLARTASDGADYTTVSGTDRGRPVSLFTVELAPGQSKTVSVDLLDMNQDAPGMSVAVTPTLAGATPDLGASFGASIIALDCTTTVK